MTVDPAHDASFFEEMRGQREPYRRLAEAIHAVLGAGAPRAVDLGCGIGAATARLAELGWEILGVDGAEEAQRMKEPGFSMVVRDLTDPSLLVGAEALPSVLRSKAMFLGYRAPIVICTETAEHLPESAAHVLVNHCVALAEEWIVWSAAPPGALWPGHVNCQPPRYWLEKFAARGWVEEPERTMRLRAEMIERQAQHAGGARNFYVLHPVA